jgi:hypothetical protein
VDRRAIAGGPALTWPLTTTTYLFNYLFIIFYYYII